MKVTIVSYSTSQLKWEGESVNSTLEELIAHCARVSNPSNQINNANNEKLLEYLIEHKHWSPFEMVSLCLEIETTRDIARQILRHRSFSFQEFSQRYADPEMMSDYPFELREARLQDPDNRQNSIVMDDEEIKREWEVIQKRVIDEAHMAYRWAVEMGIAKEQARCVLPEGNTKTRLYVNGTLRSWIHYIELRSANGTQLEHMELAKAIGKVIEEVL